MSRFWSTFILSYKNEKHSCPVVLFSHSRSHCASSYNRFILSLAKSSVRVPRESKQLHFRVLQMKRSVMLGLYMTSGLVLGMAVFDHAGSEALSSCHAFCGSTADPFTCIESHCKAMYKQRVSRFGKRNDGSSCNAICNANSDAAAERCTRCRAILRQRINRFGKRTSSPIDPVLSYFLERQLISEDPVEEVVGQDVDYQDLRESEDTLSLMKSLKRLLNAL